MQELEIKNVDCHATLAMIEKRWGFPRRTLRALLGMTKSGQSGRSMIEMLGVLAIIGVLSVGGIAGYSKAMMKYKINKTIEQITLIAGNVRSFFAPQRNYDGLGVCREKDGAPDFQKANCKLIKKAKLMPDEMWDDTAKRFKNVFGNPFHVGSFDKVCGSSDKQAFVIGADNSVPQEACVELATHDWFSLGATAVSINSELDEDYKLPISFEDAVAACHRIKTDLVCFRLYFDVDVNSYKNAGQGVLGSWYN